MLRQGISLLQTINADESETVEIRNVVYDDGSTGFCVEVTYPARDKVKEADFCDGRPFEFEGSA